LPVRESAVVDRHAMSASTSRTPRHSETFRADGDAINVGIVLGFAIGSLPARRKWARLQRRRTVGAH
jgi:hypothetical protein